MVTPGRARGHVAALDERDLQAALGEVVRERTPGSAPTHDEDVRRWRRHGYGLHALTWQSCQVSAESGNRGGGAAFRRPTTTPCSVVLVLLRLALREGPLVLLLGVVLLVGLARGERALVVRLRRVLGLLTLGEVTLVVLVFVGRLLALGEVTVRPAPSDLPCAVSSLHPVEGPCHGLLPERVLLVDLGRVHRWGPLGVLAPVLA